MRLFGHVHEGGGRIKLSRLPSHVCCGHDRALRPLVALRWPEEQPRPRATDTAATPNATLLHIWDARPAADPAMVPVVIADSGERIKVTAAAMDGNGCCIAASADGNLWACGSDGLAWLLFPELPPPTPLPSNGHQVIQVACGHAHTLVFTRAGRILALGSNARGQLGVGDTTDRDTRTLVNVDAAAAQAAGAAAVAAAAAATKAESTRGGRDEGARRGSSRMRQPRLWSADGCADVGGVLAEGTTLVVQIAASFAHGLAISSMGDLFAWGDGGDGRLGLGASRLRAEERQAGRALQERRPSPVAVPPPPPISAEASMRRLSLTPVASASKSGTFASRLLQSAGSGFPKSSALRRRGRWRRQGRGRWRRRWRTLYSPIRPPSDRNHTGTTRNHSTTRGTTSFRTEVF